MATDQEVRLPELDGTTPAQWYLSIPFIAAVATLTLTLLILIIYRKFIVILWKTFPRDVRVTVRFAKILKTLQIYKMKNITVGKTFDAVVQKYPNKVCFIFEGQEWTYKQVDDYVNRIANYFQTQGFRKGDNVALFMENRPEYVCMWLGLSKLGVVPALINYNLRLKPLLHSIEIVQSKAIIYGFELSEALQELKDEGNLSNIPIYCSGHGGKPLLETSVDLDEAVKRSLGTTPVVKDPPGFYDNLLYIYTSGTTGLPKAAIIRHARYFMVVAGGHYMQNIQEDDIQYTALPLYHTAGGMLGIGQAVSYGTTTVIRKKFSASSFWKDCIRYKVTIAQYIGEICRYLYSQPPSPEDKQHRVHRMYGNGLRPEIWQNFVDRFGIKHIGEIYGSTEGNCNIVNIDSKVGAVGFFPRLAYPLLPTSLVKIDDETGEILRDKKTLRVINCKPNETGELIGKIIANNPLRDFQGYADEVAKEKKIIRDAFKKGDAWFRSGDILTMDEYGYFYFKDRTGDTFRWKGENCSTAEVEAVISNVCGLNDAVAYGVEIPGNEGRAGMAAIADPNGTLDLDALAIGVTKNLPPYARPLFVRILKEVELTGTYKLRKVDYQKEGFDINKIKDKMYFFTNSKFIPLDSTLYESLMAGKTRL